MYGVDMTNDRRRSDSLQRSKCVLPSRTIIATGSMHKSFLHLAQIVDVLNRLHCAGHVHRSVCMSNIAICGDSAVLADLDEARPGLDYQVVKLDSPFFSAVEVESEEHLFLPPHEKTSLSKGAAARGITDGMTERCEDACAKPPFTYNALHDLESVLWVSTFLLFGTRMSIPHALLPREYIAAQRALAESILDGPSAKREAMTTAWEPLKARFVHLHPRVRASCNRLQAIGAAMTLAYKYAESGGLEKLTAEAIVQTEWQLSEDEGECWSIHDMIMAQLHAAATYHGAPGRDIILLDGLCEP